MNKNTFISELSRKLRGIPKADYDDAMNYYVEYFLDAEIDETADVTPIVGSVDDVAANILEEYSIKQFEKVEKEGGVKNSTKGIWYVILGIFAAPIAFPIPERIGTIAASVVSAKTSDEKADTRQKESEIDLLVYHLYGLTYDDVLIIDPNPPFTREEYENAYCI